MQALRNEGLGYGRIAARLNQEGVPPRAGQPWHGVAIDRILPGQKVA
jgi:hypothetical protein